MQTAALLLLVAVLAIACRSAPVEREQASRIQPYGPGRFTVSYGSLFGSGSARTAAVRDANQYCVAQGEVMVPDEEIVTENGFTLIFSCAPAQEP